MSRMARSVVIQGGMSAVSAFSHGWVSAAFTSAELAGRGDDHLDLLLGFSSRAVVLGISSTGCPDFHARGPGFAHAAYRVAGQSLRIFIQEQSFQTLEGGSSSLDLAPSGLQC